MVLRSTRRLPRRPHWGLLAMTFLWIFCSNKQQFIVLLAHKEKEEGICLPLTFPALVSLGGQDLTAFVGTASLASSVGHDGLTALGANSHIGSGQLPVGATALIAAGRGHFTLRDSHG